jgi:hypothetical protein
MLVFWDSKVRQITQFDRQKLGEECDVQVGDWHLAQMKADVVLIDGVVNSDVLRVASKASARLTLSTVRKQRGTASTASWIQVGRERISHKFVGGVTERVVDLWIHQLQGASPMLLGPPLAQEVP